jgi:NAD(P)-dependent dehydrogenase (short-subunit alcohol dehydrogenase family)
MQKSSRKRKLRPAQHQNKQPGRESLMMPKPEYDDPDYIPAGKLKGKAAIITGGDSGIGRAVASAFAKEGCDVAVIYLNEHKDALFTKKIVEAEHQKCQLIAADITKESECKKAVNRAYKELGRLDILVNNSGVHYPKDSLTKITKTQLEKTFRTNVFSFFYMTKHCLRFLPEGSVIINTATVTE